MMIIGISNPLFSNSMNFDLFEFTITRSIGRDSKIRRKNIGYPTGNNLQFNGAFKSF